MQQNTLDQLIGFFTANSTFIGLMSVLVAVLFCVALGVFCRHKMALLTQKIQTHESQERDIAKALDHKNLELEKLHATNIQQREELARLTAQKQHLESQIDALSIDKNQWLEKYERSQQQLNALQSEQSALKASMVERESSVAAQLNQLEDQKVALKKEFENLANKIFEEKNQSFSKSNDEQIGLLLKPFREQINQFQQRVDSIHDASIKGQTALNSEIKKVLDIGLKMSSEATNLTAALKGDSQQRGAWGEAQLKRTLEISGLTENVHYEAQSSFKDDHGKQKQTDFLIKLPDGKHIIIDSKVSLIAYDKALSAQSEEESDAALAEHCLAVKKHIDDLAGKDYPNLHQIHAPSFVLMFMPIEPAYIEALKYKKDLFLYGYDKSIVLVSHTTLIPILRTISNLWMLDQSNKEAREIGDKAGEIYNQVCLVAERFQKLGATMTTASKHYDDTLTALAGKQGLAGKVKRFKLISTKATKQLPEVSPLNLNFEQERLQLESENSNNED